MVSHALNIMSKHKNDQRRWSTQLTGRFVTNLQYDWVSSDVFTSPNMLAVRCQHTSGWKCENSGPPRPILVAVGQWRTDTTSCGVQRLIQSGQSYWTSLNNGQRTPGVQRSWGVYLWKISLSGTNRERQIFPAQFSLQKSNRQPSPNCRLAGNTPCMGE